MGFLMAAPIWLKGRSEEENTQAVFQTGILYHREMGKVKIHITAASLYKLWINGQFAAYGPARAAHGYARIDRVDITEFLREGINLIRVEVAGYFCYSYYTLKQPSFLQAELVTEDKESHVLAATGRDFAGYLDCRRVRKAMRYSFQRTFTEVMDLGAAPRQEPVETLSLHLTYLERGVPCPEYRTLLPKGRGVKGKFSHKEPEEYLRDRYVARIGDQISGFKEEEISWKPYFYWQGIQLAGEREETAIRGCTLEAGEYLLMDMGRNRTGFLISQIQAEEGCHYMVSFDEALVDGQIDFKRMSTINLLDYEVPAFTVAQNESFEAYGMRYACIMVTRGRLVCRDFAVRDYGYPLRELPFRSADEELDRIYRAAVETFRQNTVDVYMDCPTRERAGWLCDSYFTAAAEMAFTGDNCVERCFMENFRLYPGLVELPEGMLPMCYPADHPDGKYIPQWAMWYVLELEEFLERSPDADPGDYKELCDGLLAFFAPYENEWGLLERLPSWNFVEWSKANKWVWDVNYPTNMLYGRMCRALGGIYGDEILVEKGWRIRDAVIERGFNGSLFWDHALRDADGVLRNAADISETCQYYGALFLEIPRGEEKFGAFWQKIEEDFSPVGKKWEADPVYGTFIMEDGTGEIEPANDFIGLYMRMKILYEQGSYEQLKEEIKVLFGGMVEQTGTLWEKRDIYSSLNHGFASYVGYLIQNMEGAVEEIHKQKAAKNIVS